MACTMVAISSLARILSMRAFSTFRIFPLSGKMAWKARSRPCLALPPAESPSTRYSSHSAGMREEQSASLPGRPPPSSTLLRRASWRALRAASRATAALYTLSTILRAMAGFSSRKVESKSKAAVSDDALHLAVAQLVLGLALELRLVQLHGDHGGEAFAHVLARQARSRFSCSCREGPWPCC